LANLEPTQVILGTPTTDTKEKIINVAERLFAERGFAGTTLRNVSTEADVNLAAVNYHFGSKEELFRSVVARFARPIVEQELAMLKRLQAEKQVPSVEAVLTTLLKPCLEFLAQDKANSQHRWRHFWTCFNGYCQSNRDRSLLGSLIWLLRH
jgi:AcrR family transcriptional regulator